MHNVGETADRTDEGGGSQALDAGDQPLIIERLASHHRIDEFSCTKKAKTGRVERFLRNHARKYHGSRFASVYIARPQADPGKVYGFYTLSAASISHNDIHLSNSQRRTVPGKIDYPMAKLGYMGKADDCPVNGLGADLILDAAQRLVAETIPFAVWGIILDAELGDPESEGFKPDPDNDKLVRFYRDLNFDSLLNQSAGGHTHAMFAKLDWLIPSPT